MVRLRWLVVVGGLWLLPSIVHAQPSDTERETARNAMKRGDAAAGLGDHTAALAAYQQADAIMGVPTTGQAVAKTLERLGRLVEARNKALDVTRLAKPTREPPAFADARSAAQALALDIDPRIPSLLVVPSPRPLAFRISVDGIDVPSGAEGAPWRLNPGEHVIEVRADGFLDARETTRVVEGEQKKIDVTLSRVPTATTEPVTEPTVLPEVFMGIGFGLLGAGLAVGGITGGLAIERGNALEKICNTSAGTCPESARSDVEEADRLATVSNVAFITAGAASALGLVGLIWRVSLPAEEVSVSIAPDSVWIRGRF